MYVLLTVEMWHFICILYVYCVTAYVASDNVKINENTTTSSGVQHSIPPNLPR